MIEFAAENGHAGILKLAVSQGVRLFPDAVLGTIRAHSLECLKVAVESAPSTIPDCALVFAAANGFSEGVRYLHLRGFPLWGDTNPIDAEGLLWLRKALGFHWYIDYPLAPRGGEAPMDVDFRPHPDMEAHVDVHMEAHMDVAPPPDPDMHEETSRMQKDPWHPMELHHLARGRAGLGGRLRRAGARAQTREGSARRGR
jgi:hypothetical protein